jgi:uncharacterized protein (DUF1330 family)
VAVTVYALAQISITDRETYNRYQARFMAVLKPFGGRLLAADESPTVLEGQWNHEKVVLIAFEDEASLQAWARSPAYEDIARDRKAGSNGVVLLVKGL